MLRQIDHIEMFNSLICHLRTKLGKKKDGKDHSQATNTKRKSFYQRPVTFNFPLR